MQKSILVLNIAESSECHFIFKDLCALIVGMTHIFQLSLSFLLVSNLGYKNKI